MAKGRTNRAPQSVIDTTATVTGTAEDKQFRSFLESVGQADREGRVRVWRVDEGTRKTLPNGMFDAKGFSDLLVAERFGGGKYYAQITTANGGTFGPGASFEIVGDPKPIVNPAAPQTPPAESLAETIAKAISAAVAPLVEKVQRIESTAATVKTPDPLEMFKAAAEAVRGMQPPQPQANSQLVDTLLAHALKQQNPASQAGEVWALAEKYAARLAGVAPKKEGEEEDAPKWLKDLAPLLGAIGAEMNRRSTKPTTNLAGQQPQQPTPLQQQVSPGAAGSTAAAPGATEGGNADGIEFPALSPEQVAVLAILRGQVRDRATQDDDTATAAASIVSVLGVQGATELANQYLSTEPLDLLKLQIGTKHYAPDLEQHMEHVKEIARAILEYLKD